MNSNRTPSLSPRLRRWALWTLVALAAIAAAAWIWRPRPLVVEVATVATGRFEQAIEEDGQLRLKNRYVVAAPTAGELARPALKVGDAVRAGDVVATLSPIAPQLIDARTRGMLQQRVGSADAARLAAGAQVRRLEAALAQARVEAERAGQLARDRFIAASALEQAVLAQRSAQQALDAGRAELRAAEFALAEARAALAHAEPGTATNRAAGNDWALKSPVDGRVVKRHLDSATPVTAGQPLYEIGDTTALEAVIDVLSSEVPLIPIGAPVRLSLGSGTPAAAGWVARIEPVAFTKVSALGIEEQRVNVIVDFEPAGQQNLGDGFRADARITVSAEDGALIAPSAALVRDGASGWRVFVVENGRARARPVTVRARHADAAWIEQGLQAGDQVLLYPGSTVTDGRPVRVAGQQ